MLPIFSQSNGRTIIGYAATEHSARAQIKKLEHIQQGFSLSVWRRSKNMQEILQMPDGYVYSISK
jgi:hypothetical protein